MRKQAALLPARQALISSDGSTKLSLRLLALARDASCMIPLAFLISHGLCLSVHSIGKPGHSLGSSSSDNSSFLPLPGSRGWCNQFSLMFSSMWNCFLLKPKMKFSHSLHALRGGKPETNLGGTHFPCVIMIQLIFFKIPQRIQMTCQTSSIHRTENK